jgi:hypothetical protein
LEQRARLSVRRGNAVECIRADPPDTGEIIEETILVDETDTLH